MRNPKKNQGKGFFASMISGLSMFGNALHKSVNGYSPLTPLIMYHSSIDHRFYCCFIEFWSKTHCGFSCRELCTACSRLDFTD